MKMTKISNCVLPTDVFFHIFVNTLKSRHCKKVYRILAKIAKEDFIKIIALLYF